MKLSFWEEEEEAKASENISMKKLYITRLLALLLSFYCFLESACLYLYHLVFSCSRSATMCWHHFLVVCSGGFVAFLSKVSHFQVSNTEDIPKYLDVIVSDSVWRPVLWFRNCFVKIRRKKPLSLKSDACPIMVFLWELD